MEVTTEKSFDSVANLTRDHMMNVSLGSEKVEKEKSELAISVSDVSIPEHSNQNYSIRKQIHGQI